MLSKHVTPTDVAAVSPQLPSLWGGIPTKDFIRLIQCFRRNYECTSDNKYPQFSELLFQSHYSPTKHHSYTKAFSADCPGGFWSIELSTTGFLPNRLDEIIYRLVLTLSRPVFMGDSQAIGVTPEDVEYHLSKNETSSSFSASSIQNSLERISQTNIRIILGSPNYLCEWQCKVLNKDSVSTVDYSRLRPAYILDPQGVSLYRSTSIQDHIRVKLIPSCDWTHNNP